MAIPSYGETAEAYQTPDQFSSEVVAVLNNVRRLATAEVMQEHFDALSALDERTVCDGHLFYTEDKDVLRVLAYFTKFFARINTDPQWVMLTTSPHGKVMLKTFTNYLVSPRRNLLLWWNYFLPRVLSVKVTSEIELQDDGDKISGMCTRIQNWPTLPAFVRQLATCVVSQPLLWTEPIWSQLLQFIGDYTYQHSGEQDTGYREGREAAFAS